MSQLVNTKRIKYKVLYQTFIAAIRCYIYKLLRFASDLRKSVPEVLSTGALLRYLRKKTFCKIFNLNYNYPSVS